VDLKPGIAVSDLSLDTQDHGGTGPLKVAGRSRPGKHQLGQQRRSYQQSHRRRFPF
jgi:hypothetical protein